MRGCRVRMKAVKDFQTLSMDDGSRKVSQLMDVESPKTCGQGRCRGLRRLRRGWFFDGRLPKERGTEGTRWDWLVGLGKMNPASRLQARHCDTES